MNFKRAKKLIPQKFHSYLRDPWMTQKGWQNGKSKMAHLLFFFLKWAILKFVACAWYVVVPEIPIWPIFSYWYERDSKNGPFPFGWSRPLSDFCNYTRSLVENGKINGLFWHNVIYVNDLCQGLFGAFLGPLRIAIYILNRIQIVSICILNMFFGNKNAIFIKIETFFGQ